MIRPFGHSAACPCKDCITFDARLFKEASPRATMDITTWLEKDRNRNLNWDFEPGHCVLCGGTNAAVTIDHFQKGRYNEKQANGVWYTSLLLHKAGGWVHVYQTILTATTRPMYPAMKPLKERIADWACLFLELNPEKCVSLASRELEDWIEIRLGFTELQDEDYDGRVKRIAESVRNRSGTSQAA